LGGAGITPVAVPGSNGGWGPSVARPENGLHSFCSRNAVFIKSARIILMMVRNGALPRLGTLRPNFSKPWKQQLTFLYR
ncbi:MAG: hypothetical protein NTY53_03125, partial [Kiritimatiellaeota bacterium]|nr:hypothetical protein [Kiritimatiellota bacterium]